MLLSTRNRAGKKARRCAAAFLLAILLLPSGLMALPVAVEQVTDKVSLRQAAFFLVDGPGRMSILEASAPLGQNQFSRLEDGIPVAADGVLWLRFSLIKNNVALSSLSTENNRQLLLDLGPGSSGARLYVAESVTTDGEVKEWREFLPTYDGRFELPEPEILPLTVYVRLDGIPSLWFDPVLVRDSQDNSPFTWTLFMQIALGLALAVVLIRGMSENAEWRFWAGAILACMMIPALFGQYGSESRLIYFTAVPRLLAPGLALMLIPHLGRYLLNSRGSKALDGTLVALSVPGVITALAPLIPGLGWTARLLPLSPLLLLPLVLLALLRARRGQSGSLLYLMFCLFPFIGALLALLPLLSDSFPLLERLGPNLTILGYLMAGVVVALARPSAEAEKGDFFPLNSFLEDGIFTEVSKNGFGALDKNSSAEHADLIVERIIPEENPGSGALDDLSALLPPLEEVEAEALQDQNSLSDLASLLEPGLSIPASDPGKDSESADDDPIQKTDDESVDGPLQDVADLLESLNSPEELPEDAENSSVEPADEGRSGETQEANSTAALQTDPLLISSQPAPASLKKTEDIIYINDEEEPGLVILKPKGSAPIEGIAAAGQHPAHNWEYTAISRLENALRTPYEQLLNQLESLKERQNLAAEHADELERSLEGLGLMLDNLERVARGEPLSTEDSQTIFNLSQLIRRIHEELLPQAEERGLTLSWFVAPGLPTHFKGREQELAQAIRFLLHGTIEGAASGAVQLTVRPGSGPCEGQIQFSLLESGLRPSHLKRPSGWLNKAWELAASSGGSFNIDFIPGKGMAITLALPLTPVLEAVAEPAADPLDLPGSAALADFAPGPEPEGADEPLPGLILEEDDEDVILLTDAISPAPASLPDEATNAPHEGQATDAAQKDETIEATDAYEADKSAADPEAGTEPVSNDGSGSTAVDDTAAQNDLGETAAPTGEQFTETDGDEAHTGQAINLQSDETIPPAQDQFSHKPGEEFAEPEETAYFTDDLDPPLVILSGDDLKDLPFAATSSTVTEYEIPAADGEAANEEDLNDQGREAAPGGPREYILIADMAASGRRLISRRLEGLPHKLVEARNAEEIIKAVGLYPIGLLILDADMPEQDVKRALERIAEGNSRQGLADTPSLCLLSHESQGERMARLGCSETQIKSASRTQFRQAVLRLCPHPAASPDEMLPESPLLRQPQKLEQAGVSGQGRTEAARAGNANSLDVDGASDGVPSTYGDSIIQARKSPDKSGAMKLEKSTAEEQATKDKREERVPLLDMILASLEEETPEGSDAADSAKNVSDAVRSAEGTTNALEDDRSVSETAPADDGDKNTPKQPDEGSGNPAMNTSEGSDAKPLKDPYPLSGMSEMMEGEMVPLIPGLLIVLQDSLNDLGQARLKPDAELARDVAKRMSGQGSTFGLSTLERMARCLERASEAGDIEAIRDFADELLGLGQRFLAALRQTHEDYQKKN